MSILGIVLPTLTNELVAVNSKWSRYQYDAAVDIRSDYLKPIQIYQVLNLGIMDYKILNSEPLQTWFLQFLVSIPLI